MTYLYLDVETTGLDEKTNSIIQLSGIISKDGVEESFDYYIKPYRGESISSDITEITGITSEQAESFPSQEEVFKTFRDLLDKYISGRKSKAFLIGYNVGFDDKFMREWFSMNGVPFGWGAYVWFPYIDVMNLAAFKTMYLRADLKNFKLGTVYQHFTGKELEGAHNSMNDIIATKELFLLLAKDILFPMTKENDSPCSEI